MSERTVGVRRAVKIPLMVRPRLAKAPYLSLTSMARDVPRAWAAVPRESPCAIGLPICDIRITRNPANPPKIPTQITTAAVSDGIPPTVLVTSIAMGVVTDLAARDKITSCVAPRNLAMSTTEMMPTTQPASSEIRRGRSCLRMVESCL